MDRIDRLRGPADHTTPILEIGASHNPVAPKSAGWNTHVVDHGTQDELRVIYGALGGNVAAIEVPDTIWTTGALHEAVPAPLHGKFHRAIASHVIEHIPDFAGFLISLEHLMAHDGVVALAIPDRRYCFDYFKPPTTTGDVIEAHHTSRSRHSRRTIWNMSAYSITMGGTGAWGQHPVSEARFMAPFSGAAAQQQDFQDAADAPYVDSHAWHFTPASFALAILELGQLGIIDWHIDELHGPEGCEFLVCLKRGAEQIDSESALQSRRMVLLRQQLTELHDQAQYALAGELQLGLARLDGKLDLATADVQRRLTELHEHLGFALAGELQAGLARLDDKLDALATAVQQIDARLAYVVAVLARVGRVLRPVSGAWARLRAGSRPSRRPP